MRHHRASVVTAPGVAQATYDAAVAKLVSVGSWLDLTATITTACAGAAASDPDSLAAGLTVTTTTGTFDGETIACNSFAWTTHSTTNDGHGETLNYDLGTIASLLSGYDAAAHWVHLEACLAATGTLNSTTPMVSIAIAASGTLNATNATACGLSIASATSVSWVRALTSSAAGANAGGDPTSRVARVHVRSMPISSASRRLTIAYSTLPAASNEDASLQTNGTFASASDKLILCIGQSGTTSAAVSGLKIRFRVRLVPITNIDFRALDLGCQA